MKKISWKAILFGGLSGWGLAIVLLVIVVFDVDNP